MMVILREMVAAGRSDAEIVEFFRSRYGNYVMLAPPRSGPGGVIWLLAPALLVGGGGFFLWRLRQRGAAVEVPAQAPTLDAEQLRGTGL